MERFPTDPEQLSQNVWAHALSKLVHTKCGGKGATIKKTSRSERIKQLKQNTDLICNLLKAVIGRCQTEKTKKDVPQNRVQILSHKIFAGIGEIVRNLDKIGFL
jgi:pectate lyase